MNTPTPRTDAALRYCKTRNESGREDMAGYSVLGIQKIIVESKNLEAELTAAREELKAVTIERDEFHVKIEELAIKLQAVTEQRDRLAEACKALMKIVGEPNSTIDDCWVSEDEMDAAWNMGNEALAAVKGGGR